ncbi:MAG: hypothetical protein EON50_09880 [Acidovorax sp.]|nr:MAG: hypothetical protein EON50_09880 [Acidovorax sp.]
METQKKAFGETALRVLLHISIFVILLPTLFVVAIVAAFLSQPGFVQDGSLNGNAYAVLCGVAIAATFGALLFSKRVKAITRTSTGSLVVGTAATAFLSIAGVAALVGGLIWLLVWVFSAGWCNPRC